MAVTFSRMNKTHCLVPSCPNGIYGNGLCLKHYTRQRRHGSIDVNLRPELAMTFEERFWRYVNKTDDCWLWTGFINSTGYAKFGTPSLYAHRVAYELVVGPIPAGLELDHLCRTRHCVRPSHLEPVTHRENVLRGNGLAAQQARKTHCPKGHLYNEANTRWYGNRRICKQCNRERYVPKGQR